MATTTVSPLARSALHRLCACLQTSLVLAALCGMPSAATHELCLPAVPDAVLEVVEPQAGPPGTTISLRGDPGWRLQGECTAPNYGDGNCIGAVLVGDSICSLPTPSDADSIISWATSLRYNYQYIVKCTMREPGSTRNGGWRHA